MPKEVMIKGNWWKEICSKVKPKYISGDDVQPIEVEVEFPKDLYDELDKDPLLLQQLSDAGSKEYKEFLGKCEKHLRDGEKDTAKALDDFEKDKDVGKLDKAQKDILHEFVGNLKKEKEKAEDEIPKAIKEAYKKQQQKRKDYKDYKIRAGAKIVLKAANIGFCVARLVVTAGGDLFAWQSLLKDSVKSIDEMVTLAMTANQLKESIQANLKTVVSWQKKLGDGKGATAGEVGLGLLKIVVGTDGGATIESVAADTKTFKNKLGGIDEKAHDAAKDLNEALKQMDKVKDELPKEINVELANLEADVSKLIDSVASFVKQCSDGEEWAKNITKQCESMKQAKSTEKLGRILKGIETAWDIGMTGKGWGTVANNASAIAQQVGKTAVTVGKNIDRWMDDAKKLKAKLA